MHQGGHLLRVLGIGFGLAAVVGGMVGQGILRSPGIVAEAVHHPWLMMALWTFGALVSVLSALPYAELGTAIPRAGGPYDYFRRAFGTKAGVFAGWSVFLTLASTLGMLAYVTGEFLIRLNAFPGADPAWPALLVLALFYAVNCVSTRLSGASQVALSAVKGGALVVLVVILLAQPGEASPGAAVPAGAVGVLGIALALRVILGTYAGWQDLVLFSEEMEAPARSIPRALFGGIAAVAALYLLVNLALLHVLTPAQMAGSNLAAADAAATVFGARGDLLLTLFGVVSVAAITNAALMCSGRIAFAMGRAGILPRVLAEVSASGSPRVALSVMTMLAAGFVATGTFHSLNAASTSLYQLNVVLVTLAAVGLRLREPDLARPFRVRWFGPVVGLSLLLNGALLIAFVIEEPRGALLGLGLLLVAFGGSLLATRMRPAAAAPA